MGGLEVPPIRHRLLLSAVLGIKDPMPHQHVSPEAPQGHQTASAFFSKNWGSHGHPEFCRKPCLYLLRNGRCHVGDACRQCHLPHSGPSAKLNKEQRRLVQSIGKGDLLAVVLPHIRRRASQTGLLSPFAARLQLILSHQTLAQTSCTCSSCSQVGIMEVPPCVPGKLNQIITYLEDELVRSEMQAAVSWQELKHLDKALSRMSLVTLITMVAKYAHSSPEHVHQMIEDLRVHLPPSELSATISL